MGSVPQPFETHFSGSVGSVGAIGPVGPVSVAGIPDTYHINIDNLPRIRIGVEPVTLHLDPVEFSMRIKEIPSVRGHLPADFSVGLSLLGVELMCVRLCGEAQIITEPYRPNPCEHCGLQLTRAADGATDVTHVAAQAAPVSGSGGGT